MKHHKVKFMIVLSTALLLLFFTSINVYTTYIKMKTTVQESLANQNLEAAKSIAAGIDVDTYQQFLNDPVRNEYYEEIKKYLMDAREKLGVLYVYTLAIDNPKIADVMIVGFPKDMQDTFTIGEVCEMPEENVREAYEGKTYVTGIIEDPNHGVYLSVGAPIKNAEGEIIGHIGVDISAETLNSIKTTVLKNNISIFIFNGLFILVMIGSLLFMQRWYQKATKQAVDYTEDTYQTEIKALISSVSSVRHDFTNHVQVIHGFLQLEEAELAKQYAASLAKEVQTIESLTFDINHPGLAILLQTKKLAAQNYQIDMDFNYSPDAFDQVKTTDLIKILSNLIDNAIDATIELPEEHRKITIDCQVHKAQYVFTITNTGHKLMKNGHFFEQGYSTKKPAHGVIRGQGLFIVKEVVQKYKGTITLQSINDMETVAVVKIPLK